MIFRKDGSQRCKAACQSGTAAKSPARSYNSAPCFRKQRAPTTRCSLISRHAPRKRRPITPAAAWTQKENQSTVTMASCEVRLEDPELPIPNRLKSEIPDRQASEKLEASNIKARGAISDF